MTTAEVYEQYYPKILSYIRSRISDSYTAEDLCSDVFLKVCQKLESFDAGKASLATWIYTIARNTLTDYFRTAKSHDEIPEDFAEGSNIEEDICREETLEQLADALEQLDERDRDIIIMHYYSHIKLKDIAEKMGISYSYAKVRHAAALEKMKRYFD